MTINKKKKLILISILIIAFLIINYNLYYPLRSYAIMFPYSFIHKYNSFINKIDFNIHIPGGLSTKERDWYPFMIYFNNDKGFSKHINKNLSITILYNFGAFNHKSGMSSYYDANSPYYSSFYGAYIIRDNDNPINMFGYNKNNTLNIDEISKLVTYDQKNLVLTSLGLDSTKSSFNFDITNINKNIDYLGHTNWTKVDAKIKTNGPIHRFKSHKRGYIQYGRPPHLDPDISNFPVIDLYGRVYIKYFDEYNITVILYGMMSSMEILNQWDEEILEKTIIY